jgi:hypothetical protein
MSKTVPGLHLRQTLYDKDKWKLVYVEYTNDFPGRSSIKCLDIYYDGVNVRFLIEYKPPRVPPAELLDLYDFWRYMIQ